MGVYSVIRAIVSVLSLCCGNGLSDEVLEKQIQDLVDLADQTATTEPEAAMEHLRSAIRLEQKQSDEGNTANAVWLRLRLAALLGSTGQIDDELKELEQIQTLGKKVFDNNSTQSDWAFLLEGLATRVEEDLGDYKRALSLMQQSIEVYRISAGEKSSDYGNGLSNLVRIEERMGLHAEARKHALLAVEILRDQEPQDPLRFASAQNNLSQVLLREGAFEEAVRVLLEAKKVLLPHVDENRPDENLRFYAGLVHQLAAAYDGLLAQLKRNADPRADEVRDLLESEFEIELRLRTEKLGLPQNHYEVLSTKNSHAAFLLENGNPSAAEPRFRELAEQTAGIAGLQELHVAALLHLAISHERQDHSLEAKLTIREALTEAENHILPGAFLRTVVLKRAARILGGPEGDLLWNQSLNDLHQWVDATASSQPTANQFNMAQLYLPIVHEYVFQAVVERTDSGDRYQPNPEDVYRHLMSWKGGVFLRQRVLQQAIKSGEPEVVAIAQQLESKTQKLSELLGSATELTSEIEDVRREVDSLESHLSSKIPLPHMYVDESMLLQLKNSLPDKSVLVDIYEIQAPMDNLALQSHIVAFIVSKELPIRIVDLGPSSAITSAIVEWQNAIQDLSNIDRLKSATNKVQKLLWMPIETIGSLRNQRTLFVSPDGPVSGFPLSALPAWTEGREYLVEEDLVLACLPSPIILLIPKTESRHDNAKSLLFANPLAMTNSVSRTLEGLFKQGNFRSLAGKKATCEAFRQHCGNYSTVYVYGHGVSNAIAGPPKDDALRSIRGDEEVAIEFYEGQRLTACEMAFLPLSNARLVCLVACQSGLGRPLRGEPLLSMCRAAHVAGADAVLASLWDVDQAASSIIAESLIRGAIGNGEQPAIALRNAQRKFYLRARNAGELEAHPFFWAAWSISLSRP